MKGEGKSKLAMKYVKAYEKVMNQTFQDSKCEKGNHKWIKIISFQKVWYMIFIYTNQRDEKLVCLNCSKEVRT